MDKNKPLMFGPLDHLELITTDSKITDQVTNNDCCDIIAVNLTLCAFYTEKIMYYELVQILIDDFIRTMYCRLANETTRILPKRLFLNHYNAKYSIYIADSNTVKVRLLARNRNIQQIFR